MREKKQTTKALIMRKIKEMEMVVRARGKLLLLTKIKNNLS